MAAGAPGRPPTRQIDSSRSRHGVTARPMPVVDFARPEDYEAIAALLTSDEAREVLKRLQRQSGYFTRLDLEELKTLCESEGNAEIYARKVAALRDRNEPVPIMLTIREIDGDVIQAYGVGGMLKRSQEEARASRNALALNKSSRARAIEENKQLDVFDGLEQPEDMTLEQVEAELAQQHGIAVVVDLDARRAEAHAKSGG